MVYDLGCLARFIAKKLCPELIFVPIHHGRYSELSAAVMFILRRYDPSLLPAGCDEAYLNITMYCQTHDMSPTECVQDLRKAIFDETKLTASAGIAPTKVLPDATCGDIFTHRATVYLMDKQFGSHYLFKTYLGVTSNVVRPHSRSERKSIGAERTFLPLADKDQIMEKLKDVATELENDMKQHGWTGRTITLKFKLDTFQGRPDSMPVFTRAKSFDRWITKKEDLFAHCLMSGKTGKELLLPEFPLILRLIGLRVTKLKDLRAPPEPVGGIKYFFEPLKDKPVRDKSNAEEEMDVHPTANEDHLDNTEETMPGFYEMDEDDQNIVMDFSEHHGHEDLETILTAESTTPPRRENTSKIPQTQLQSSRKGKSKRPLTPDEEEVHDCPICGRTLRTDNHGLNTHIDFCLSRDAIRQAQAETTSPIKASPLGLKPISKGKRKGR
ncbi:hypothetical protein H0H93_005829 [Arthromyces matolae]|nr:hypothetical protein H0H93_005829 [Arthromyces matolae]